jgi:hypothetical protein
MKKLPHRTWVLRCFSGSSPAPAAGDGGAGGSNIRGNNEWWRFYPLIDNALAPPVIQSIGEAIAAVRWA